MIRSKLLRIVVISFSFTCTSAALAQQDGVAKQTSNLDNVQLTYRGFKKQSDSVEFWVKLSDSQLQENQPLLAIMSLAHAIHLQPNSAFLYRKLALAYQKANLPQKQMAALKEAERLQLSPALPRPKFITSQENQTGVAKKEEKMAPKENLPQLGYKAELEKRWNDAIAIYRKMLVAEPNRADLWVRIANVAESGKMYQLEIDALKQALKIKPNDATIYFQLSQTYINTKQPKESLASVKIAIQLDPNNVQYLKSQGEIADWNGDEKLAIASYRRILQLKPEDQATQLAIISIESRHNLDAAAYDYRRFVLRHPENADGWLAYAQVQTYRGDYVDSLKLLERYRQLKGENEIYIANKARTLGWAGRGNATLAVINPLVEKYPNNYQYLYTQTLGYNARNQYNAALKNLKKLNELEPKSEETTYLNKFIKTPLRSNVTLGGYHSYDTESLEVNRGTFGGQFFLNPNSQILMGGRHEDLHAKLGTGFETITGAPGITDSVGWAGLYQRFTPDFALSGVVGNGHVSSFGNFLYYDTNAFVRLGDKGSFNLEQYQDLYDVSPLTASLKITQIDTHARLFLEPSISQYLNIDAEYAPFSDGNHMMQLTVAPSYAIMRIENMNCDVGALANWMGFTKQLNNGYYNPASYQRYAFTTSFYWKKSENTGYSLYSVIGQQKDENLDHFVLAGDVTAQATYGIYRNWQLIFAATDSNRGQNIGQGYNVYSFNAYLTRRF